MAQASPLIDAKDKGGTEYQSLVSKLLRRSQGI